MFFKKQFMITTSELAPSSALSPFIRCYAFREFDTKGKDMEKPLHASHEMTLVFFFKEKPVKLFDPNTNKIVTHGTYCDVAGLTTHNIGIATFNGAYSFFEICFRPNGFNKIFDFPANWITDHIIPTEDILGLNFKFLFEQLCEAKDLTERCTLTEKYLLDNLKRQKHVVYKDCITVISNLILKKSISMSVKQLAYSANMSTRNFERHFSEEVGMSPKLFSSVVRFNHAFAMKLKFPQSDWTSIALECGYFDQMHLIKDFKRFSGSVPSTFLKQTPITNETYISRIDA